MNRLIPTSRSGFTIIELLVVITIAAVLMALSFPMINAMQRDNSASAGINTVTLAVTVARRYATDPQFRFVNPDINPANNIADEQGLYSGVAAVFTPAGEVRLTKNYESAVYRYNNLFWYLERSGPRVHDRVTLDEQITGQPERELNGFTDINLDYILLGSDVGVAGITRDMNLVDFDEPPLLIPPPFAVWFDQSGYLISTGQDPFTGTPNDYQYAYYDGNRDGNYRVDLDRWNTSVTPYNPNEFNPNHGDYIRDNYDDIEGKYLLGIEKLEAVIGVYVFSQEAFDTAVQDGVLESWADGLDNPRDMSANEDYWEWMQENGEMILFSRQTGMIMRDRDE